MDSEKQEIHIHGLVQGLVIGTGNSVTLVYQSGERRTVPFLAPPQPSYDLIGRDGLMHELKAKLLAGKKLALSALGGLPGVGKTALAVALAYDPEMLGHFSEGILWAGLGRDASETTVLSTLSLWGAALEIPSSELEKLSDVKSRRDRIQAAIGQRHMLLIIDDAWKIELAWQLKVAGPNCAYLLTTRIPEVATRYAREGMIVVHELSEEDSLLLLRRLAPSVIDAEIEEAQQLVQAVGYLPLALTLMGNYLRVKALNGQPHRLREALDRLKQVEERLKVDEPQGELGYHPSLPASTPLSLYAVIDLSVQDLDPATRIALSTLALFPAKPNTFSREAACEVTATPVVILDNLSDAGILEVRGPTRYTLHQTIHDYAGLFLQEYALGEISYKRFISYYTNFIVTHERDYEELIEDQNNVLTMIQVAETHNLLTPFVQAVIAFSHFLETQGRYKQAIEYLQKAHQAVLKQSEHEWLTRILLYLGRINEKSGNYSEARQQLEEGLALARQMNHPLLIGTYLYNLGRLDLNAAEDIDRAEDHFLEGLALAEVLQDSELLSACLTNLGVITGWRGNPHQEQEYYKRALTIALQGNLRERVSGLLMNLGALAGVHGDLAQAVRYYESALDYARQIGHRERMITVSHGLADIFTRQGNFQQAEQEYLESLKLATQIGHQQLKATTLFNLADVVKRWNCTEAESYARQALKDVKTVANPKVESYVLNNLGSILMLQGHFTEALKDAQEAVTLARQTKDAQTLVAALQAQAEIQVLQGNIQEAEQGAQEGLALAKQIEDPEYEGLFWLTRGICAQKSGETSLAEQYYQNALLLARSTPSRDLISSILYEMGRLLEQRGDRKEAKAVLNEALKVIPEHSKWLRALLDYELARAAVMQGDHEEGKSLGKASVSILEQTGHYKATEMRQWLTTLEP